jgi:hypothetical protein
LVEKFVGKLVRKLFFRVHFLPGKHEILYIVDGTGYLIAYMCVKACNPYEATKTAENTEKKTVHQSARKSQKFD